MHASPLAKCPSCGRSVARAQVCDHCAAIEEEWARRPLRPIILPDGPGLSARDTLPTRRDGRWLMLFGLGAVMAAVFFVYHLIPSQEPSTVAVSPPQAAVNTSTPIIEIPRAVAATIGDAGIAPELRADSSAAFSGARPETDLRPSAARTPDLAVNTTAAQRTAVAARVNGAPDVVEAGDTLAAPAPPPPTIEPAAVAAPRVVRGAAATFTTSVVTGVVTGVVVKAVPDVTPPATTLIEESDVRSAVAHFVAGIRARSATNFDLLGFYGDGAEHRVSLRAAPPAIDAASATTRVAFELSLSKRDAVGRRFSRVLPVTMTITKRAGAVELSAVAFGALRKP